MYVRPTASVERNVDGDCVQCAVSWTRSERPGRRSLCPNGRRVPRTVFQMPFPSGRNTLLLLLFFFSFEVFVERQESNRAPTETARQAGRLLPGREEGGRREREGGAGGVTTSTQKKKKNPWNFCEELEGYPESCNSNKLDSGAPMTSSPAPRCAALRSSEPCGAHTLGAARGKEQGHSAAGQGFDSFFLGRFKSFYAPS